MGGPRTSRGTECKMCGKNSRWRCGGVHKGDEGDAGGAAKGGERKNSRMVVGLFEGNSWNEAESSIVW